MKRLWLVLLFSTMMLVPAFALNFETATGTDVVNENGEKESGYSSAQLETIKEKLAGKVLTFENGTVSGVSRGFDGKLSVTMSFVADKSKGFFASRFTVSAKVSDPTDMKWAACLDEGAKITKVTGTVDKGGLFFTIVDAKIVPEKMPEVKRMFDPEKVTGQDVVNGNGVKESGYSSAQLDQAKEELAGKTLTFENGTVSGVSRGFDGKLSVTMSFVADKSKGFFASRFTVSAKVSDPTDMKWAACLDEGAKITKVTGTVDKGGLFFTIVDAKIVPEKMPEVKRMFDPEKVTGQDVVNGNGVKESGYSSAQLEKIQEELAGKSLTFENGKVFSVSKDWSGNLSVKISFKADTSKGFFSSSFSVDAKVSDPATVKWAVNLDEGAKIKSLTGTVAKKGAMVMFFTVEDAKIILAK